MQTNHSYRKEPAQRLNISSAPRRGRAATSGSSRAPFAWDSPQGRPPKRALAREDDPIAAEETVAPAPPMVLEPAVETVVKPSSRGGNEPDKENLVVQVTESTPPSAAEVQETPDLDKREAALMLLHALVTPLERALNRERHDGALGIAMRALGLPEELAPHLKDAMEGASLHEVVADLLAPAAPAANKEEVLTTAAPPAVVPPAVRSAAAAPADAGELEELHAREEAMRQREEAMRQREAALEASTAAATARAESAEAEVARLTEQASALKAQLECLDEVDVMRGEGGMGATGLAQAVLPKHGDGLPAAVQGAAEGPQKQEEDLIAWREAAEKARQMVRQTRGRGGPQQQSQPSPAAPCLMDEDIPTVDGVTAATMAAFEAAPVADDLQEEPPAKRARTAVAWVVGGGEEAEEGEAEGAPQQEEQQEQEQEQETGAEEPGRKAMVWVVDGTEEAAEEAEGEEKEPEAAQAMDVAEPPQPAKKGLVWVVDGDEEVEEGEVEAEEPKPVEPTVEVEEEEEEEDSEPKGMAWVI